MTLKKKLHLACSRIIVARYHPPVCAVPSPQQLETGATQDKEQWHPGYAQTQDSAGTCE